MRRDEIARAMNRSPAAARVLRVTLSGAVPAAHLYMISCFGSETDPIIRSTYVIQLSLLLEYFFCWK